MALRHMELTLATTWMHERKAVLEMRGQLSKYKLDEPGSVAIRNRLVRVETPQDIEAILRPIASDEI
jgi:hypothetical protein